MISWPGRKKKQLPQLLRFVPHNILDDCAICEPFFGTGEFTRALLDTCDRGCFTTDFRLCLQAMQDACPDNVLVYLDPPYILETGTYQTDCWGNQELSTLMDWIQGLETDGHWWMMTDYLANGDQTHPYAEAIKTHCQVYPLERKHNSRPNGTSDAKEEVIIVGGSVGEPYPIDSTTNQAALFQEE